MNPTQNQEPTQQAVNPAVPANAQQPAQQGVPSYAITQPGQPKIRTYRALSIVTIFFSLLFGILAINSSRSVSRAIAAGDYATATKASKTTLTYIIIGFSISAVYIVIRIIASSH